MKRRTIWTGIVALLIATASMSVLAEDKKASELLQSGVTKETIQGDLDAAIAFYERAFKEAGSNRSLAARAQLRIGAAYQKQGSDQARDVFERLLRDYADQKESVAEAQQRLSALVSLRPSTSPAQRGTEPSTEVVSPSAERLITLFDRSGRMLTTVGDPIPATPGSGAMVLSPDGKRVAVVRGGAITVYDVAARTGINLTSGPFDAQPAWSPDGSRIAYQSSLTSSVYIISSFGGGKEELVHSPLGDGFTLVSWTRDGGYLTFQERGGGMGYNLWVLPLSGDRKPIMILGTPAAETGPRISPDGRYLAYRSNESGRSEVYVRPFSLSNPNPSPTDPKWRVSVDPGIQTAGVRWRSDGKEMYYISLDGLWMAVDVTTSPTFTAGTPRALFRVPPAYQAAQNTAGYSDVSADGRIFALYMPH
jgi:hypothetical protein